jgi:5-methylphenazine-1-carboxylate 1-monooxygenase
MLWRGCTVWPAWRDGRTMVIAGGNFAKFVFYPIAADPGRDCMRLTNWAVMARISDGSSPPPRRTTPASRSTIASTDLRDEAQVGTRTA